MRRLYYAYGSNMATRRLLSRVAGARALGPARLHGMQWVCNKLGRDGTAKANLRRDPDGIVWGVLWELSAGDLERLDRFEGGYVRHEVRVVTAESEHVAATYLSARVVHEPEVAPEYLSWLLEGAREHGLPAAWIERIARVTVTPGPGAP